MKKIFKFAPNTATVILASLTLLVLLASVPGSLKHTADRGGFYLFSRSFIEDLPRRLSGPGRFRFILQPLIASILGIRNGISDARDGRPPYLWAIFFHPEQRLHLLRSGFRSTLNLLMMGILLDSIAQWLILGASYPGAAVVVGPVLITVPYAVARALANRCARLRKGQ